MRCRIVASRRRRAPAARARPARRRAAAAGRRWRSQLESARRRGGPSGEHAARARERARPRSRAALGELREIAHGLVPAVARRRGARGLRSRHSRRRADADIRLPGALSRRALRSRDRDDRVPRRDRGRSAARGTTAACASSVPAATGGLRLVGRPRTTPPPEVAGRPRRPRGCARRRAAASSAPTLPRGSRVELPCASMLADDEALLREGLVAAADRRRRRGRGAAASAPPRRCASVALTRPDVAIVDIRMPPTHTNEGLVAAQEIRRRHPSVGVPGPLALPRVALRAAPVRGGARARRLPAQGARGRRGGLRGRPAAHRARASACFDPTIVSRLMRAPPCAGASQRAHGP